MNRRSFLTRLSMLAVVPVVTTVSNAQETITSDDTLVIDKDVIINGKVEIRAQESGVVLNIKPTPLVQTKTDTIYSVEPSSLLVVTAR